MQDGQNNSALRHLLIGPQSMPNQLLKWAIMPFTFSRNSGSTAIKKTNRINNMTNIGTIFFRIVFSPYPGIYTSLANTTRRGE